MSGLLPPPEPAPARKAVPGVVRLPLRSGVFLVSTRSLSESGGFVVTWHVAAVRGCGCRWRAARRTMIEGRHGHREPGRARPSRSAGGASIRSRKRIVLGSSGSGFSWEASAGREPMTQAVWSPSALPAGWCHSLRTSGLRRFLRHFGAIFAVFPEQNTIPTVPTRGALALFEGGRRRPPEAAGCRKSVSHPFMRCGRALSHGHA